MLTSTRKGLSVFMFSNSIIHYFQIDLFRATPVETRLNWTLAQVAHMSKAWLTTATSD